MIAHIARVISSLMFNLFEVSVILLLRKGDKVKQRFERSYRRQLTAEQGENRKVNQICGSGFWDNEMKIRKSKLSKT